MTFKRKTDDADAKAYWEFVDEVSKSVEKDMPEWKKELGYDDLYSSDIDEDSKDLDGKPVKRYFR